MGTTSCQGIGGKISIAAKRFSDATVGLRRSTIISTVSRLVNATLSGKTVVTASFGIGDQTWQSGFSLVYIRTARVTL